MKMPNPRPLFPKPPPPPGPPSKARRPGHDGWKAARKPHLCAGCGEMIPKGALYWREVPPENEHETGVLPGAYCSQNCFVRDYWRR